MAPFSQIPHRARRPAVLLAGVLFVACSRSGGAPAAGRNLLLVTLDTTRADALGCLGGDPRSTPRLDALAERSTLFTFATSETNITNPSHISIMTGLPAIEHRVVSNKVFLPPRLDTLPEALGRAGYETAAFIGAWHLASLEWRGFETKPGVDGVLDGAEVAGRAVRWLRERPGGRPFFAWVHFFDPHILYQPPRELAREFYPGDPAAGSGPRLVDAVEFDPERDETLMQWLGDVRDPAYPRAMYAATVRHVDDQVGRLLDALAELGLGDETVVVVVGDHGETLDDHEPYYNHRGLYEEDLRIPLLVHLPGAPAGRHAGPVSTIDVAPTLEEALGFRLGRRPSGTSLLPTVLGEDNPALAERRVLVHQQAHNQSVAVREGHWKLWRPIAAGGASVPGEPLLFHLGEDPGELHDLSGSEPGRVAELEQLIGPWIRARETDRGTLMRRSKEEREKLRELGYAGGDDE